MEDESAFFSHSPRSVFFYLFIYYFQQAAKYACSFMNSLFHSEYFVCSKRAGEGDCKHYYIHTYTRHVFLYIRKCIILFLYLSDWLAGRLPNCVSLTWLDLIRYRFGYG